MTLIPICRVTALSSRSVGIDDAKIQKLFRKGAFLNEKLQKKAILLAISDFIPTYFNNFLPLLSSSNIFICCMAI